MRRLPLLLLLVALVAVAAPATAAADDEQFAETRAQIAGARTLVEQAVEAARAGDRERGYDLAREAYLDHFELAEVPLRLRDPNLVLDLEFKFAELRNGIRDGDSVAQVRADAVAVRQGLPVVIVSTRLVGRTIPAGDIETRDIRRRARQERALDRARDR